MLELDDHELLAEFAGTNSELAFATLIARHVNLVYSAALRVTGNQHHAEEITQAVFIILARKAGKLSSRIVFSGWLYQVARFTAANFLKGEIRRQHREQEAYVQTILNDGGDVLAQKIHEENWNQIAPLLDEAMGKLGETDRDAVVLRFFENKTAAEIAAKLKLTEAAAHKRLSRALEKLRKFFVKRGVSSTTAIIAGTISANSVQAAPIGLAKTISAVAIAKGVVAGGSTLILVQGTMKTMTWLKTTLVTVILTNAIVSQKIVATHFDFAGNPDGWMTHSNYVLSSLMFGCAFPLFFVAIGYLPRFLPIKAFNIPHRDYWLAPERRDETFNYLFRHSFWQACFAAIFALALQLLVVQANHQTPPHFSSPLAWAAAGCFVAATAVWIGILLRHFMHTTTHTHI